MKETEKWLQIAFFIWCIVLITAGLIGAWLDPDRFERMIQVVTNSMKFVGGGLAIALGAYQYQRQNFKLKMNGNGKGTTG